MNALLKAKFLFKKLLMLRAVFLVLFIAVPTLATAAALGDGVFIYDQTTPTTNVQSRTWTELTTTVGAASSPFAGSGVSKHIYARGSDTRPEMLLGIQDAAGLLTIYMSTDYGVTWVSQFTATVGDGNLKRFEIAYEQTSGNALVIYSANLATTNEIKYQTWNGTTWSGPLNLDTIRTSGTIYGIRSAERSGSNEVAIMWVDTNLDISTNVWTGAGWFGEPAAALSTSISRSGGAAPSAVPTRRGYDLAFESLSGDLLVIWGDDSGSTTQIDPKYVIKPAGGAWGAAVSIANLTEDGEMIDVAASPISDKIALSTCSVDTGADCNSIVWSGTAWGTVRSDTTSAAAIVGESSNNVEWLVDGVNEVAIMTYSDAAGGGIDWHTSANGATPATQTDNSLAPAIAGLERAGFAKVNPTDSREAIFIFEDANADVFVKRAYLTGTTVAWSNPTGLSTAIELNTSVTGFNPVGFVFNRYTPPTPTLTSYTNTTEPSLNYAAACTGCGARIGGGAGFRQSITITGTNFGTVAAGSRSTATNNIKVGTHQIADVNVTVWTPTSITFLTDSSVAGDTDTDWGVNFGGASAITVTSGTFTSATGLNFYIFPQVTSVTQPIGFAADTAREYDAADTDGVITLNGTRLGSSQGAGTVTTVAQTAVVNSWTNTAIEVQVPATIVDTTNTGSIAMTQGTGANGKTHTYANTLRILPRITGFTPISASEGGVVTVNGNHFCQAVSCPVAFGAGDKVTFTSAKDATVFTSWSAIAMATIVPVGAVTGNVVITSNTYTSNGRGFTVLSNTPTPPTSLNQWKNAALTQSIAVGGAASSTPIYLTMTIEVPGISGGTIYPQIEYQAIGTPFACGVGVCVTATEGLGGAGPGPINCGLTANSCAIAISPTDNVYHWQARVRHNKAGSDYFSSWVSFDGVNPETSTDFQIDTTGPSITSVSSGSPGSNTATITWSTLGEVSTSQVQYNTTGTFGVCAGDCTTLDATMVNSHSVPLSNLSSGTTYYYRVRSKDVAGNESVSINYTFTTSSVTQPAKTTKAYIDGATGVVSGATTYYFTVNLPETSPSVQNAYVEVFGVISGGTGTVALQANGATVRTYDVSAASPTLYRLLYRIPNPGVETNLNLNDVTPCSNDNTPGILPETSPCNSLVVTPGTVSMYVLSAKIITTYAYTP